MTTLRVRGHTLLREGKLRYDTAGWLLDYWQCQEAPAGSLRAKCSCQALSPAEVQSASAAKRWHRQHKADVQAAAAANRPT